MYSSVALLALAHTVGLVVPEPRWSGDYGAALSQAAKVQKPLAVVIGSGKQGWEELSDEGRLSQDAKKVLIEKYVCVYVDASKAAGKTLARSFEASQLPMLVLSDRSLKVQEFRHSGSMDDGQLESTLERHAVSKATVTTPSRVVRSATPAPARTAPTTIHRAHYSAPSYSAPSFHGGYGGGFGGGGFGGGCPT